MAQCAPCLHPLEHDPRVQPKRTARASDVLARVLELHLPVEHSQLPPHTPQPFGQLIHRPKRCRSAHMPAHAATGHFRFLGSYVRGVSWADHPVAYFVAGKQMATLPLFVEGAERPSAATEHIDVLDPATQDLLCK